MAETGVPAAGGRPCGAAPAEDLYIYYLQGRLKPQPAVFGDAFLGNWEEEGFSFLFFSKPSDRRVAHILDGQPHLTLVDKYHMTYEQWQGGRVEACRMGRFFICPPWETVDAPEGSTEIVLDPGVVFGNGAHPTTRDCLDALELLFETAPVASMLDLGTGTGILALAAAKMGCLRNLAVDSNFLAAKTAALNVRLNGLERRVGVIQGRAEQWAHVPADLMMANIHHDVMKTLVGSGGIFTKKWFVLSGLLRSQAKEIAQRLAGQPVEILKRWDRDGIWHTFLGRVCEKEPCDFDLSRKVKNGNQVLGLQRVDSGFREKLH